MIEKTGEAKLNSTLCSACNNVATTLVNGHLACEECKDRLATTPEGEKQAEDKKATEIYFPECDTSSET